MIPRLGLPIAPAIMVGDELVVQGYDVAPSVINLALSGRTG